MKRLFSLTLLCGLGLMATMPATAQKKDKLEPPNCSSSSISGLILNPGCNSPELNSNNKELICNYKNKDYLIGEIYLKATTIFDDVYFIQLEKGNKLVVKFSTTEGKGDIGDPVLVIKQGNNYYVEKFQPKWIASLPGVNLSDRKINSVISRYLKTGETVDSFCQKSPSE
ncbi:MAG: hypothetical protein VKL42_12310 [Snowella sp.]|nr:hypothetical protein [Snowella sp.]